MTAASPPIRHLPQPLPLVGACHGFGEADAGARCGVPASSIANALLHPPHAGDIR